MTMRNSLMFKLSFLILSFTFLIFAGILTFNYNMTKRILLKNTMKNAELLTSATVGKIDSIFKSNAKIPENLAFAMENPELTEEEIRELLVSVVKNNPEIYGSCVGFAPFAFGRDREYFAPYAWKTNGEVKYRNIGNESYQYFYLDWFQIPKELGRPVWTEPYYDEGGGNIIMTTYSVPFYRQIDGRREFSGIVTVDISINWLEKIFTAIKACRTGFGFLISGNGNFVTFPKEEFIMNESIFSVAEEKGDPELRETGRKMIQGKSGLAPVSEKTLGRNGFIYYTPVTSCGWSVGVLFPEDELFEEINELHGKLMVIAFFGMAVLFFVILSIAAHITRPIVKLALVAGKVGAGDLSAELPKIRSLDEIGRLTMSFSLMQKHLAEYIRNLKETTSAKEKIESELKIAHDIQMSIIPKTFPPPPARKEFDLYAILNPAKSVGGDLYDFFYLPDDKLCFTVGDVSGKGVPASLFMAVTRTMLRAKAINLNSSDQMIASVNSDLCKENDMAMFVTSFVGILNLKNGEVQFTNAGHNSPYIIRKELVETLQDVHGMPLGIDDLPYSYSKVMMNPGDSIVIFTDGVTEAVDIKEKLYGEERLEKALAQAYDLSPRAIIEKIVSELEDYSAGAEQADDITILVIKFKGG